MSKKYNTKERSMSEKDVDIHCNKAREELNDRMVTKWMVAKSKCGKSSYNAITNYAWCACDVDRLKKKGIMACVVKRGDFVAVFRLKEGEDKKTIIEIIDSAKIEIKEG